MPGRAIPDLGALLTRLREEDGLPIGIDRLAAAEILLHRRLTGVALDDPVQVADVLAPLLATNPREQAAVRRRVFEMQPDAGLAVDHAEAGGRAVPIELREAAEARARQGRAAASRRAGRVGLLALLGAVVVVLLLWVSGISLGPGAANQTTDDPRLRWPVIGEPPVRLSDPRVVAGVLAGLAAYLMLLRLRPEAPAPRPPDAGRLARAWESPDAERTHLLPSGRLRGALRGMRAAPQADRRQVDLPASIRATARLGGLPTLVDARRAPVPAYLLLADSRDRRDQSGLLPEILVRRLQSALLRLEAHAVAPDGASARPWGRAAAPSVALGSLLSSHAGRRLILVSDGAAWWDPLADALVEGARAFLPLAMRILLTPVPRAAWGAREDCYRRAGFVVVELTPGGLDALARWLEAPGEPMAGEPPHRLRDIAAELERQAATLVSERAPPQAQQDLLRDRLHIWLGPAGWHLLAAVALHPRPGPGLTARLATRLARESLDGQRLALDEATVSRVTRLPWLRRGRMPGWLRRMLAGGLAPELRQPVAEVYLRFLAGEDGAPFRADAETRATLLARVQAGPAEGVSAPDSMLSAFLVAEATPAPLGWRARVAGWLAALAVPVGAVAVGVLAGVAWGFAAPVVEGLEAPMWLAGPLAGVMMATVLLGLYRFRLEQPIAATVLVGIALVSLGVLAAVPEPASRSPDVLLSAQWLLEGLRIMAVGVALAALSALPAQERRIAVAWDFGRVSGGVPFVAVVAALGTVWASSLLGPGVDAAGSLAWVAPGLIALMLAAGSVALLPPGVTLAQKWRLACLFVGGAVVTMGGVLALGSWAAPAIRNMAIFSADAAVAVGVLMLGLARGLPGSAVWRIAVVGMIGLLQAPLIFSVHAFGVAWLVLVLAVPFRLLLVPLRRALSPAGLAATVLNAAMAAVSVWGGLGDGALVPVTIGVAGQYAAVIWLLRAPQDPVVWRLPRVWVEALPLLLCGVIVSMFGEVFALPLLALPLAAWLGARHGAVALPAVAAMLVPMLVPLVLSDLRTAGSTGLYLAALLVARVAGDAGLLRAIQSATALPGRWFLPVVLGLLPWFVATPQFSGIRPAIDLWSLMVVLLLAVGLGQAPLRPVLGWVAGAFVVGFGLRLLGFPLTAPALGRLDYGMESPADLLLMLMLLCGPRSLPRLAAREAWWAAGFAVAVALSRLRVGPDGWPSLVGEVGQVALVSDLMLMLFVLGVGMLRPRRWWVLPVVYAVVRGGIALLLPRGFSGPYWQVAGDGVVLVLCQTAVMLAFARLGAALPGWAGPASAGSEASLMDAVRGEVARATRVGVVILLLAAAGAVAAMRIADTAGAAKGY